MGVSGRYFEGDQFEDIGGAHTRAQKLGQSNQKMGRTGLQVVKIEPIEFEK